MKYLILLFMIACQNQHTSRMENITTSAVINGNPVSDEDLSKSIIWLTFTGGRCSGILISKNVVLTAAHCYDKTAEYSVFIGTTKSNANTIKKIIPHPEYENSPEGYHDLAVVFLNEDVNQEFRPMPIYAGKMVGKSLPLYSAGFSTKSRPQRYNIFNVLNEAIKDDYEFSNLYEDGPEALFRAIIPLDVGEDQNNNLFYFSQAAGGICSGDSGGPTLIKHEGKFLLAGINTAVLGSHENEFYDCEFIGLATEVNAYQDWIEQTIMSEDASAAEFMKVKKVVTGEKEQACNNILQNNFNIYNSLYADAKEICAFDRNEVGQRLSKLGLDCTETCSGLAGYEDQCEFYSRGDRKLLSYMSTVCEENKKDDADPLSLLIDNSKI